MQQWIKRMLYWKKLCGKVLIIPTHKTFSVRPESYSLVPFTGSWSLLLWKMCIALHLYRNSDILSYLFKTNRVLCNWIIQGPPNMPVKCGIFHLYLFPVTDTWRWREASDSKQSVAISYCKIPNACTVLFISASSVMIKRWLCSSVTFPCGCYCLGFGSQVNRSLGFGMHHKQLTESDPGVDLRGWRGLSCGVRPRREGKAERGRRRLVSHQGIERVNAISLGTSWLWDQTRVLLFLLLFCYCLSFHFYFYYSRENGGSKAKPKN